LSFNHKKIDVDLATNKVPCLFYIQYLLSRLRSIQANNLRKGVEALRHVSGAGGCGALSSVALNRPITNLDYSSGIARQEWEIAL